MSNLEAHNLSCGYGDRQVLKALSLAAHPGEVLILLGPNGAGKTTLLRALARLLRPGSGSVFMQERDIWEFRGHEYARRVALTPQTERRDWPLTVEESIRLGRAPHRGWLLPFTADDHRVVGCEWQQAGCSGRCCSWSPMTLPAPSPRLPNCLSASSRRWLEVRFFCTC